jgi:hypothetical protein
VPAQRTYVLIRTHPAVSTKRPDLGLVTLVLEYDHWLPDRWGIQRKLAALASGPGV